MNMPQFCPDITKVEKPEFRPYMVECAYDYYMICITSPHQRMGIQNVMCALAIEVLLKSFNADVTSNQGRLDETYRFNKKGSLAPNANAHDLMVLYNSLPPEIQMYLFDKEDIDTLESNKDLFTSGRYTYEVNANQTHSDDLIKLAASLVCKIVYLYSKRGCQDPFIIHFDVNKLFFNHVQPILWWPQS